MKHFIVATAGHVDHGKTALVRALTGVDTDRLPEEKARGITIDLGFAHLVLPGLELGIVDVPGHEDFVKNMVAGVGSVDVALFVVAADDGWMPQTEEHLQILTYLGVTRAVVALTKADLAPDEAAAVAGVRARLAGSPFADAPVIPTVAPAGRGLPELRAALAAVLADALPPRDIGKPRLPVDRVFALRGIGTVVTGTLTGGSLPPGRGVIVQPSGRRGHVRSVQSHGHEVALALPGTRTAVNLPELAAAGDEAVTRGEVVTLPELGDASHTLDVWLTRSSRGSNGLRPDKPDPLADGKTVRLHLGSGHATARVSLLASRELPPGTQGVARLRCERPVFACVGDRFILRDGSEQRTLAGGMVLDPEASSHRRFRRGPQRRFLERVAAWVKDEAEPWTLLGATLERDGSLPLAGLLRRTPFSAAEIESATRRLAAEGQAVRTASFVVSAAWWQALGTRATDLVDAEHRGRPERIGLPLARWRAGLQKSPSTPELLNDLLADLLARAALIQVGASVRRPTHRPTLPAHLETAGERLRTELSRQPFEPPNRKALTPDGPSRQALRFLFDTGEALEFGEEVVLLEESFRRMRAIITRTLRAVGPATASDLRQVIGTTRRVLIPVLERLDRDGVTRRDGDRRTLR